MEPLTVKELLHHACTHPQMSGDTFLSVAQFVNGYDCGYTAALRRAYPEAEHELAGLSRFRQWLAEKTGGSQCRCWETIVYQHFPDDETRYRQAILLFEEFQSGKKIDLPSQV